MKIIYSVILFYLRLKYLFLILISSLRYKYNKKNTEECFEITNQIKKNGYYVIKNYLTNMQCKVIIDDINLYVKYSKHKIFTDKEKSDFRIFGANNLKNKYILNFFRDEKLLMIAENYMKLKVENAFTMAGKLVFAEKNIGSGGGWHRDNINSNIKAMVYLVNTKKRNGPFQILKKSNTFINVLNDHKLLNKIKFTDTRFLNSEIMKIAKKKYKIKTITGSAGTLIIFDGSNIHRGSPIQENTRYALTNYYAPKMRVKIERKSVSKFLLGAKLN